MTEPRRLLIVEDDPHLAETLASAFARRGHAVHTAPREDMAITLARRLRPSHAIVDLKLAEGSGLGVVKALAALDPPPAIVVLTGFAAVATAVEAIKLGATQYLAKPATAREIEAAFSHRAGMAMPEIETPQVGVKAQEWELIQRTLAETGFNVSETARRLGMHRRTLARKLAARKAAGEDPGRMIDFED
ncbi:response regulator [Rhodobacter capsulatus]|uniref:Two-component system, response regulator RegA n=1 Tax=Rhodobacter capsulatus TaxID=1061 RepID=A0A0Q0QEC8_RHOCA|nr:response regulator [Rhodobacter capsulatus]KQB12093.1 two-component system response regulator [Rhodobacter capsulatus]KQB16151.1 two-component system response regulator [Rhodobacter capsulatus]PZX22106.1 two-component system response regulator RegA [Rhodobacter capsulatus]QNR62143.1 response regulator [Rhodobacter capsulatus]WER08133.1 response regulator [Rhodobacter capsulatus]